MNSTTISVRKYLPFRSWKPIKELSTEKGVFISGHRSKSGCYRPLFRVIIILPHAYSKIKARAQQLYLVDVPNFGLLTFLRKVSLVSESPLKTAHRVLMVDKYWLQRYIPNLIFLHVSYFLQTQIVRGLWLELIDINILAWFVFLIMDLKLIWDVF